MKPTTFEELYKAVDKKEIISAIDKEGKVHRLFVATNGYLCKFKPRSGRHGYRVYESEFDNFATFKSAPEPKTDNEKLKRKYNTIAKYKKLASEATFSNSFIEECKKLPSFDKWINDKVKSSYNDVITNKGLYELHITTGNKIDGKVISISRIAKQYPHYAQMLRDAIKNQSEGHICSSTPFAGYEMTLSTAKNEVGQFFGYCSLEYKGCGNGYYYLLINDENFIGYDVD